jgi:hypothetical protein
MSRNFQKLNLPIPFLNTEFDLTSVKQIIKVNPHTILNPELFNLVESSGKIKIVNCIVLYYSAMHEPSRIHIDDDDVYDQTNLNLVIGGTNSKTFWYEPVDGYNGEVVKTPFTTIRKYNNAKLRIIESRNINGTCLFQGAVPHNVINQINERWCVNLKLKTINNEWVDWNTALQLFNCYLTN